MQTMTSEELELMIVFAITYLFVGIILCVVLRTDIPPSHWRKYIELILGWPIILTLAVLGKL